MINAGVQVSLLHDDVGTGSGVAGSHGSSSVSCLRHLHSHSIMAELIYIPTNEKILFSNTGNIPYSEISFSDICLDYLKLLSY
jgi:hypothetical protein